MQRNFYFLFFFISSLVLVQCAPKIAKQANKSDTTPKAQTNPPPQAAPPRALEVNPQSTVNIGGETDPVPAGDIGAEEKAIYQKMVRENGRLIWSVKCQKCHELYSPDTRTTAQWDKILLVMAVKADLDETEKMHVTAYLHENAKK